MQKILVALILLAIALPVHTSSAQYEPGDGFEVAWTLDPRSDAEHFPRGPAFGARGVLAGMDFDNDGNKEFLFSTDETLAPQGPDPGFLDVYLYENNGDNSYEYVWHYTHTEGSNSLPPIAYGDLDSDGLWEIYFGIPTINDDPIDLYVFEQGEDGTFPNEPTTTWDYGRDGALDFRPAAFAIADVDGDGQDELVTGSRTAGAREIVVAAPVGAIDAFTVWASEFEAGEDLLGGGAIYDVDVFDFDNDGMNEIWVNTWDLFSFTVFEATGDDTYELQVDINEAHDAFDHGSFNSHKLLWNDIDGDGRSELVVPTTSGYLFVLDDMDDVSQLTGPDFVEVGSFLGDGGATESRGADIGDIDYDGMTDIVISLGNNETVINLEFQGGDPFDMANYERTTVFTQTDAETVDRYYPLRITDDLDGDGKREIVVSNLFASDEGQNMIIVVESTGEATAVEDNKPGIPDGYVLAQTYPNPFNPSTTVVFEVPETVNVDVSAYDVSGRMVRTLRSGVVSAGTHSVTFEAGDLPSGVYIIVMQTPHGSLTRKAMLLK